MNKLALVIGHKESSQGAVNKDSGVTEWGFNSRFVKKITRELWEKHQWNILGFPNSKHNQARIFHRTSTITDLVNRINAWNPDLAIEFHCNSYKEKWIAKLLRFEKEATGTEMLLSKIHKPIFGKPLSSFLIKANNISLAISDTLGINFRPAKFRGRWQRGGYFLNKTKCKAIIAETFFIDNNSDLAKANENYDKLVQAPVDWIVNYFKER